MFQSLPQKRKFKQSSGLFKSSRQSSRKAVLSNDHLILLVWVLQLGCVSFLVSPPTPPTATVVQSLVASQPQWGGQGQPGPAAWGLLSLQGRAQPTEPERGLESEAQIDTPAHLGLRTSARKAQGTLSSTSGGIGFKGRLELFFILNKYRYVTK